MWMAFHAYDTIDGANCQTVWPEKMTQREAALLAVRKIGLNQEHEAEKAWFQGREQEYAMFTERLRMLKAL